MMGVHLAGVVAGITAIPTVVGIVFRKTLPLPVAVVLWHLVGTGAAVGVAASGAFAARSTWLLGKRKDGSISPVSRALLWPYHVGLRMKLGIQRRVSSEPAWNQITPTFYLGGWPSEEALAPAVHPAVLDVTCELPLQVRPPAYKMIPVWDTHSPSPEQLDAAVAWAQTQERDGLPVLVHCAHGHGRSATVLAAILIANGQAASIAEAEAIMKRARPRVRLNTRQKATLTEWFQRRGKRD